MSTSIPAAPPARSEPAKPPSVHFNFLDGLRGFAALYVVCFHFLSWGTPNLPRAAHLLVAWSNFGHVAVTVFIALSGFSLMLPVARSADRRLQGGVGEYFKRRARRILPPYYAALGISLLVAAAIPGVFGGFGLMGVASHLLLFQNLTLDWHDQINMALWTVATEWQIYFLLPFVLLPAWRRFGNVALLAVGIVLGLLPAFGLHWGIDLSCSCFWYVGVFALGAVGAVLAARPATTKTETIRLNRTLGAIALAMPVLYALTLKFVSPLHSLDMGPNIARYYVGEALKDTIVGGLVFCLLVYCARDIHRMTPPSWIVRCLESPLARRLGAFSYSLYLTHCIVLGVMIWYAHRLGLTPVVQLAFLGLIGIPVAVGLAYLFYLGCEKPVLGKRR